MEKVALVYKNSKISKMQQDRISVIIEMCF